MPADKKHTIMAVDDEEGILKSLRRLLKQLGVEVLTANNGLDALKLLKDNAVSLIISDQRMPGIQGVDFLSRSKELVPDCIRILLTGYADIDTTIEAINAGAVDYYFNKPWDDELLLSRIEESLKRFDLQAENKRLEDLTRLQNKKLKKLNNSLEQRVAEQTEELEVRNKELRDSFMETIKAFSTLMEYRSEKVGSHSHRVAYLARLMASEFNMSDKEHQDIVVAAFIHDIGKIGITDLLLNKAPENLTEEDEEDLKKHVFLGQSCIYSISGFEDVAVIVRHHHEDFDGCGYPDGLKADAIPLGSRIIRLADEFDNVAFRDGYPTLEIVKAASAHLVKYAGIRFDPRLVKIFIDKDMERVFARKESAEMRSLKPANLEPDMVVARDVYTRNGMFLLPKGAKLSQGMIRRLNNIDKYDRIDKGVFVFQDLEEETIYEKDTKIQDIISG